LIIADGVTFQREDIVPDSVCKKNTYNRLYIHLTFDQGQH